jgi:hypothetical protein
MIARKSSTRNKIEFIEKRFLESTNLNVDLSKYPLIENVDLSHPPLENQQVTTNKEKSDLHGEVFTPLWLVDYMLDKLSDEEWQNQELTTEDLCAGYGQFSVRMLRKKYSLLGESFKIDKFLNETHLFSELQPSSCYRLLYTFGTDIRLLMGDVTQRSKLPDEAETGIWVYRDKWYDETEKVKDLFDSCTNSRVEENSKLFEKRMALI